MAKESIRIMSYNICHYNFDQGPDGFPADLLDEKLGNLKRMLMETGPDFVGLQEDCMYVDAAGKKKAGTAVFSPVWRFTAGTCECTLRAKFSAVSGTHKLVRFSTGRFYRRAIFSYTPTKERILFISCHPSAYAENEGKRKTEYTELFDYIRSETWNHCIVTGDFNTNTNKDRATLKSLCEKNQFSMAIGSYLPWLPTCLGHDGKERLSFDNILVSKGLTIRTTKVLREWYKRLYSDHVPMICEVTL